MFTVAFTIRDNCLSISSLYERKVLLTCWPRLRPLLPQLTMFLNLICSVTVQAPYRRVDPAGAELEQSEKAQEGFLKELNTLGRCVIFFACPHHPGQQANAINAGFKEQERLRPAESFGLLSAWQAWFWLLIVQSPNVLHSYV